MCAICGCSPGTHGSGFPGGEEVHGAGSHGHGEGCTHAHEHVHAPGQGHEHPHPIRSPHQDAGDREARRLRFERDLLAENDRLAAENRAWLGARRSVALNLLGSPGSGKTTLLERTIEFLHPDLPISVLEGDQATDLDAERIRAMGVPVLQINTGSGCHLNAGMVGEHLRLLQPERRSLVFVENVGNLVCPALFDIGERAKVLVMSLTEGEEKPLKYPATFQAAEVLILNKVDLLPHLPIDLDRCLDNVRRVNPRIRIFPASATSGIGLDDYFEWLRALLSRDLAAEREGGA